MSTIEFAYNDAEIINKIKEILDIEKQNSAVKKIIEEVLKTHGKLLRPKLLLTISKIGENYDEQKALLLGAIVEILHMASLIHDDIVDDSPMRRGNVSVQSHFGKDMAVYTGDFLLSRLAMSLFEKGMSEEGVLVTRAIESMCNGELSQYDMKFFIDENIENYMTNISGKTASLFELSCRLGCMAGKISDETEKNICEFAHKIGIMFQIRDDLLDFAIDLKYDGKDEGKPVFMDFQSGILTLPVICAMQSATHKKILSDLLETAKTQSLNEQEIILLKDTVFASGGMEKCKNILSDYGKSAEKNLGAIPECTSKKMLKQILDKLFKI